MMIPPLAYAIAAFGLFAAGFAGGYKTCDTQHKAAAFDIQVAEDKALRAAAEAISNLTVVQKTIHQKIEKEIHEKPVYLRADCAVDADGVRLLNAQILGTEPASDSKLPQVGTVAGWLNGKRSAEAIGDSQPVQPMQKGGAE